MIRITAVLRLRALRGLLALALLYASPLLSFSQSDTTVVRRDTLDEVSVSDGYRKISPARSTGSYALVDSAMLSRRVGMYITDRLENTVAGVQFNRKTDGPGITVRGLSSIQASNAPLVVVDNFPYEGSINDINPSDVLSVSILKDAAAMSIWGARAGNGVIVITTKNGSAGQRPRTVFSVTNTVAGKEDLMSLRTMDGKSYTGMESLLFSKGFYDSKINDAGFPALTPAVEMLLRHRQGSLSDQALSDSLVSFGAVDLRKEYLDNFYKNSRLQQYNVALSGGSARVNHYLSLGYDRSADNLDARTERFSLRDKTTVQPGKNVKITTDAYYQETATVSGRPAYGSIKMGDGSDLYPYASFRNTEGKAVPLDVYYRKSYLDTAGGGLLLDWNYYPLEDYIHTSYRTRLRSLQLSSDISYRPVGFLELVLQYQYQSQWTEARQLYDRESYYTRNYVNLFSQVDQSQGTVRRIVPEGSILSNQNSTLVAHNLRGQVNFRQEYKNWSVSALGGAEVRQSSAASSANYTYGYDDDFLTYSNMDFTGSYPTYVTGYTSTVPSGINYSGTQYRFVSFYGNTAVSFRDEYILSGSIRKDGSNIFGVKTNEKGVPLWSLGAKWRILGQKRKIPFLSRLDLRGSYGSSGNIDLSKSAVTTLTYSSSASYTNYRLAMVSQLDNPDLRWEKSNMLNISLDFGSSDNRWDGTVEWYSKKGKDLFGTSPVDYTGTGLQQTLTRNVASMKGSGIDVTVNYRAVLHGSFRWTINGLFSLNRSRVTSYYNPDISAADVVGTGAVITPLEGKPLYSVISYRWAGLDHKEGNPQGRLNGAVSTDYSAILYDTPIDSLVYHGSATPILYGAVTNTLAYRNFQLGITLGYSLGYYYRRPSINYSQLVNSGKTDSDYNRRWQSPGDEANTYVPSFVYPVDSNRDQFYNGASVLVDRADNIRLQTINLSCQLHRWSVHANLTNIGILWKASDLHYDPDYSSNGLTPPMSMSLGATFTF